MAALAMRGMESLLIVTPTPGWQCIFSQRTGGSLLRNLPLKTLNLKVCRIPGCNPSYPDSWCWTFYENHRLFPLSIPRPRLLKSLSCTSDWPSYTPGHTIMIFEMRRSPNLWGWRQGVGRDRDTQRDIFFLLKASVESEWGCSSHLGMSLSIPCLSQPSVCGDFHLYGDGWMPLDMTTTGIFFYACR